LQNLSQILEVSLDVGDTVTITERDEGDFRTWRNNEYPLITADNEDGKLVLISISHMDVFTEDEAGIIAGNNFFAYFNQGGVITSLPEGSFDTHKIANVGDGFFGHFNESGALTRLPVGSFNTSKITSAGYDFFTFFNHDGALTILPDDSFNTSNIITVGDYFFFAFNIGGRLVKDVRGVQIYNPNGVLTAYYWNSSDETIIHGQSMYYKSRTTTLTSNL
jgi:surface protein